jgi:hypothetical protein
MADSNTTVITRRPMSGDALFREGAMQGLETLRRIYAWGSRDYSDQAPAEEYAELDSLIESALAPLGDLTDRQRGYVQALIETLVNGYSSGLTEGYEPDAARDPAEVAKERAAYAKTWAKEHNVLPFKRHD